MKLAQKRHSKEEMELNRVSFYERFRNLKKSNDIDSPHLTYIPESEYPGEGITETQYQHEQQPS